jgi:hypothetical protein
MGPFLLFLALLFFAALVLGTRLYAGQFAGVTLLEYQRGVIYRQGKPVQDVGPGRYRVWTGIDKVIHLDTRPIQVSYEAQQVGLKDGTSAQYAIAASARVQDPRKALYSSVNYAQIPAFVFLSCARSVLNNSTSSQLKLRPEAASEQIIERAKPRLAAAGFELLAFRMPQLEIRGAAGDHAAGELQ